MLRSPSTWFVLTLHQPTIIRSLKVLASRWVKLGRPNSKSPKINRHSLTHHNFPKPVVSYTHSVTVPPSVELVRSSGMYGGITKTIVVLRIRRILLQRLKRRFHGSRSHSQPFLQQLQCLSFYLLSSFLRIPAQQRTCLHRSHSNNLSHTTKTETEQEGTSTVERERTNRQSPSSGILLFILWLTHKLTVHRYMLTNMDINLVPQFLRLALI